MAKEQLLHLVFGGELTDPQGTEFVDTDGLDLVGIYPNYKSALVAWRARSQAPVDDATSDISSSICTGSLIRRTNNDFTDQIHEAVAATVCSRTKC